MSFKEKRRFAEKLVESKKASFLKSKPVSIMDFHGLSYGPHLHRLLWKLGVKIPPPHFSRYAQNRLLFGASLGIGMLIGCILGSLLVDRPLYASLPFLIVLSISAIGCGHVIAKLYQRESEFYQIPLWDDFHPEISEKV